MISQKAIDALNECKNLLIDEVYNKLVNIDGQKKDVDVDFLNAFDGDCEIDGITAVYIKDDIVFFNYFDSYEMDLEDPAELFTIDTIAEVLSQL